MEVENHPNPSSQKSEQPSCHDTHFLIGLCFFSEDMKPIHAVIFLGTCDPEVATHNQQVGNPERQTLDHGVMSYDVSLARPHLALIKNNEASIRCHN